MYTPEEIARWIKLMRETRKEIDEQLQKLAEDTARRKAKLHTAHSDMSDAYTYAQHIREQTEQRAFRGSCGPIHTFVADFNNVDSEDDILHSYSARRIKIDEDNEHIPEGFTYVSEAEYTKTAYWLRCVENLPGWSICVTAGLYCKKSKIGGMYSIGNRQINTTKFEEAIVLDWNGVPTINGIRYHMSKGNRLEPRYNKCVDDISY